MDAAPSLWRPLGEMLVDRELLTREELDEVLALQRESGRKLGEIIVERGYISGPTLALTLAEQWGVELSSDEGFGTGLRNEIQRRHEGEQRRRPTLQPVEREEIKGHEIFATAGDDGALAEVSAQLAEDDARIVHLEARLLERDDRIAKLEEDARAREERIAELVAAEVSRLEQTLKDEAAKLEQKFGETQKDLLAAAAEWRAKHEGQIVRLLADKLGRLEAGMKESRGPVLADHERARLEARIVELVSEHVRKAQTELVSAVAKQLEALGSSPAPELDLSAHEARVGELVSEHLRKARTDLVAAVAKQRTEDDAALTKTLTEKLHGFEQRLGEAADKRKADEAHLSKLVTDKLDGLAASPEPVADYSVHEARITEFVAKEVARVEKALLGETARADAKRSSERKRLLELIARLEAALESVSQPRKRDDLEALGSDLRATVKRLDRLEELVRASTRELIERFEAPLPPPQPAPPQPEVDEDEADELPEFNEHLVFAPAESGYALITVELPPPDVGAELALGDDGERFVVTKVADSPFPRDERPCAYVQRVS